MKGKQGLELHEREPALIRHVDRKVESPWSALVSTGSAGHGEETEESIGT